MTATNSPTPLPLPQWQRQAAREAAEREAAKSDRFRKHEADEKAKADAAAAQAALHMKRQEAEKPAVLAELAKIENEFDVKALPEAQSRFDALMASPEAQLSELFNAWRKLRLCTAREVSVRYVAAQIRASYGGGRSGVDRTDPLEGTTFAGVVDQHLAMITTTFGRDLSSTLSARVGSAGAAASATIK